VLAGYDSGKHAEIGRSAQKRVAKRAKIGRRSPRKRSSSKSPWVLEKKSSKIAKKKWSKATSKSKRSRIKLVYQKKSSKARLKEVV
jgi:hypothetical protein